MRTITQITEVKAQIKAVEVKIKTNDSLLTRYEKTGRQPYSVQATILKKVRETYKDNGITKLWNSLGASSKYIVDENSIYFNTCTLIIGQGLWYDLEDSEKEAVREVITSDKDETQNAVREIVNRVFKNKVHEKAHELQSELQNLKDDLEILNLELEEESDTKEQLDSSTDIESQYVQNNKKIEELKNENLDFEKQIAQKKEEAVKAVKVTVIKSKLKGKAKENFVKKSTKKPSTKVMKVSQQIIQLDKKTIIEAYKNGHSLTAIAEGLNKLYKENFTKGVTKISHNHIRDLLVEAKVIRANDLLKKRTPKQKAANSTSYKNSTKGKRA